MALALRIEDTEKADTWIKQSAEGCLATVDQLVTFLSREFELTRRWMRMCGGAAATVSAFPEEALPEGFTRRVGVDRRRSKYARRCADARRAGLAAADLAW